MSAVSLLPGLGWVTADTNLFILQKISIDQGLLASPASECVCTGQTLAVSGHSLFLLSLHLNLGTL